MREKDPTKTWTNLVLMAQAGDAEAFSDIVRRYQDMAVGYAYSILGDFDLAQDAAQEAFLQAYLDLPRLRVAAAFASWFRRIVFKHCDRLVRGKRVRTVSIAVAGEPASPDESPREAAERREFQEKVLATIRALPESQRTVVTLYYINGYSQAEVAAFLEVPLTTVKSRLRSARARLRERMTDMVEKTLKDNAPKDDFGEGLRGLLKKFQRNMSGGIWATDDEDLARIRKRIKELIRRNGYTKECVRGVHSIYARMNDYEGIGRLLGEYLKQPLPLEEEAWARGWSARSLASAGKHEEAIAAHAELLEWGRENMKPEEIPFLMWPASGVSHSWAAVGRVDEGVAVLQGIARTEPKTTDNRICRVHNATPAARVLHEAERYDEAVAALDLAYEIVEEDPQYEKYVWIRCGVTSVKINILHRAGDARRKTKAIREATDFLDKNLEKARNATGVERQFYFVACSNLGGNLVEMGEFRVALQCIERAIDSGECNLLQVQIMHCRATWGSTRDAAKTISLLKKLAFWFEGKKDFYRKWKEFDDFPALDDDWNVI